MMLYVAARADTADVSNCDYLGGRRTHKKTQMLMVANPIGLKHQQSIIIF